MIIHYSPYFNSRSHLDVAQRGAAMLGTSVCGTVQLLEQLELRCGIVAPEQSEHERMVAFNNVLMDVAGDTVFNESFKVDPIGTSRQVMTWCDILAMEGWTSEMPSGDSAKLASLAKVALKVKVKGMAQRWNDILTYISQNSILTKDDTIEVHSPREVIPAVVLRVLDKLEAKFLYTTPPPLGSGDLLKVQRVLQGGNAEALKHDGSLTIKHFKHRANAYQWYLLNNNDFTDSVTVCYDTSLLNDLAHAIGCQQVDSTSSQSNPQVLQLFKLGLSLFARPLNVYNLLSYLRISGHPAGGVTYLLAKALVNDGGIGDNWQQTIADYNFTVDGKDQREERMKFLDLVTRNHPDNDIITDEVRQYANDLAHWADKHLHSENVDDLRKEQLAVLAAYCRSLANALPNSDTISAKDLQQLINGIYQPHAFTHCRATRHSAETIASPLQLVDPAKSLCWLGCVGCDIMPYPFDFINYSERQHLKQQGIALPLQTEYHALHQQMIADNLSCISERLTLVTWDYDGNDAVEQHPVITQLATTFKDWGQIVDEPQLPSKQVNILQLEPKADYQVGDLLSGKRREYESYSSLEKLIQHPFDYALEYLAEMQEPNDMQIDDIDKTKGNVAHLVVEQWVKEYTNTGSFTLPEDSVLLKRIERAINHRGAILLLPENKFEHDSFVIKLSESLKTLADIIRTQCLHPVDSEVNIKVEIPSIGIFDAKIDLLLKDQHGHYVIFDLKWTSSNNHKDMLESNTSLQLELYRQAIKRNFELNYQPRVAYYLFTQCKLVTADDFAPHAAIQKVKVNAARANCNLFEEIKASVQFRRTELDNGRIEESELMELAGIPYAQQQGLVPLMEQKDEKGHKGVPYVFKPKKDKKTWDNNKKDPKSIATTHPILKDRLK